MSYKHIWLVMLFSAIIQFSTAQIDTNSCNTSCHCIRNLTPSGVMISHVHPKNEWMLSYRFMSMQHDSPISGSQPVSENDVYNSYLTYTSKMRMNMHMFMAMYGFTDRLTAMFMFNGLSNNMQMNMFTDHDHDHSHGDSHGDSSSEMTMKTSGLSDTKLHLLYGLIKSSTSQLVLGTGISIPTGSIELKGKSDDMFYANKRYPYMMQVGSGTFDFLPSITYVNQQNDLAYSFQVSSTLRLNTSKVGYTYGNEVGFNAWIGYNWWKGFGSTFRLEGTFVDKMKGNDSSIYAFNEIAANPINYGNSRLLGFLGLSYQFENGWIANNRLSVEFGLPMYQYVNGIQNQLKHTISASWSYSF